MHAGQRTIQCQTVTKQSVASLSVAEAQQLQVDDLILAEMMRNLCAMNLQGPRAMIQQLSTCKKKSCSQPTNSHSLTRIPGLSPLQVALLTLALSSDDL